MNFINPFDLLEIDTTDNEAIRKAKRLKLNDIELNDGFLEIGHHKVSKSEFIRLIDELDDDKRKKMYFFVKRNTHLNLFLLNNDIKFFYLYQPHKAYQNQDFINFISPYFAESFNKLLFRAFESGNSIVVNKLFSVPLLVNHEDTDKLYKKLSRLLNEKIDHLQEIKDSIDEDIDGIMDAIESIINIDLLNSLPSYFQSNRNAIAMELRHISIDIWNEFNYLQISCDIIYYALKIEIDGVTKIKINDALEQLKELEEKQKQEEKDKIVIKKWGDVLSEIKNLTDDVENGEIDINKIPSIINKLFSINELNNLPDSFDEINRYVALSLKGLSIAIWNEYDDGDIANNILVLAGKIKTDSETQEIIYQSYNDLQQAIKDYKTHKQNNDIIEHYKNIFEELIGLAKRIDEGAIQRKNIDIQRIKIVDINSLNKLSDDFDEVRNQLALMLRSLSISVYNSFENTNLSLEIIKYAQLIDVDNETYSLLASAYNQLQEIIEKNKRREDDLNFNTSIRGDLVSVNSNKVTYKNKSLITKDIDKIRFGVYVNYTNGIRSSSYYTIWYSDKYGNSIEIECNRLLNSTETVENQYRQILEASYNIVIPHVLQNIESYFNAEKSIKIGDLTVSKKGLNYETGAFFWKENQFLKWQDVTFSSNHGVLSVIDKQKNKVIGNLGFRDYWNAVIFQLIKEYVIGIKG